MRNDVCELFAFVEQAMEKEEAGVAIYMGHLSAILSRAGLQQDDQLRARRVVTEILETNRGHVAILRDLIRRMEADADHDNPTRYR